MKAILVLDEMPENCRECQFEDQDDFRRKNICNATAGDRAINDFEDEVDEDERPDWCPLKELPERKTKCHDAVESGVFDYGWATTYWYETAWNECLEAIENGEEE